MNRIDTPVFDDSIVSEVRPPGRIVPLAQRLAEQAPEALSKPVVEPDPLPGPGEDPFPLPVPIEDPVRQWAMQSFMEKMFYGEEEENGIPPLSIEI